VRYKADFSTSAVLTRTYYVVYLEVISKLLIVTARPEAFIVGRSISVRNAQRVLCVRELLADLAIAILHRTTSRRCFLSSLAQYSAVARQ
jgi:hypothetical protein